MSMLSLQEEPLPHLVHGGPVRAQIGRPSNPRTNCAGASDAARCIQSRTMLCEGCMSAKGLSVSETVAKDARLPLCKTMLQALLPRICAVMDWLGGTAVRERALRSHPLETWRILSIPDCLTFAVATEQSWCAATIYGHVPLVGILSHGREDNNRSQMVGCSQAIFSPSRR